MCEINSDDKKQYKIVVVSDTHHDVARLERLLPVINGADRLVFCGDGLSDIMHIRGCITVPIICVKGNNDFSTAVSYLPYAMEDNAVMYHFNRKLFFTHGDRYNALRVPPILEVGDALIHGHTHVGHLQKYNGLYVLNVGSLARPRDGVPNYLILDDVGATLKQINGETLRQLKW